MRECTMTIPRHPATDVLYTVDAHCINAISITGFLDKKCSTNDKCSQMTKLDTESSPQ